jgi:hypothetical protein
VKYKYSFNLAEQAYLEKTEAIFTLLQERHRKYSSQQVTKFSQGNNVQDSHASNTDGFLWRDTRVSSIS